jgi:hypothetical protein
MEITTKKGKKYLNLIFLKKLKVDMRKRDTRPARGATADGAPGGTNTKFLKIFLTIFTIFPQNYLK